MDNLLTATTLILGTILSVFVFIKFDIICFGWKGILGLWTACVFATGLIIALFGGLIGFLFKAVWFLIKAGIVIAIIGYLYSVISNLFKGRKTS